MIQNNKVVIGIGLISLVIIGGAIFLLSKPNQKSPPQILTVDTNLLVREDSQKMATDSAKVTMVEFSDFQCPACAIAHPLVRKVLDNYKGRINFVFRHFPLPQHSLAIKAAEAAEAAGEQGKFWEMADKLFAGQGDWEKADKPSDVFISYAKDLGLNTDKFKQELEGGKFADKIKRDYQDAVSLQISVTPTFFLDGQKMEGVLTFEDFKTQIDARLNR